MSYWAKTEAPDPGAYNFALYRPDWNPKVGYTERHTSEVATSRCIVWPKAGPFPNRPRGRDVRWQPTAEKPDTCMIFIRDRHLKTRCMKLGWLDVSDLWKEANTPKTAAPPAQQASAPMLAVPLGGPVAPALPAKDGPAHGRHGSKKATANSEART